MSIQVKEPVTMIDSESFRAVAGHFATGVTVITASGVGQLHGSTASAVCSLSLEPPMMLVCLNRSSSTHAAILSSGVFAVNILASDQEPVARRFARRDDAKFEDAGYDLGPGGVPLLHDALAHIVCRVVSTTRGGTHTVFLGEVAEAEITTAEPLTYYRGRFGRFLQSA